MRQLNTPIFVRRADRGDINFIGLCLTDAFPRWQLPQPALALLDQSTEASCGVYVAEAGESIVGVIALSARGGKLCIETLAIRQSMQATDSAKALLRHARCRALQLGCDSVFFAVVDQGKESQSLCRQLGWRMAMDSDVGAEYGLR